MRTRNKLTLAWLTLSLALSAVACGDDKGEAAPPGDAGGGFLDEDADVDAAVEADGGAQTGDDAGGNTDPDAGPSCTGKDGCYSCEPETNLQFLNSCADGCRKFDQTSYPTSWKPGQALPALP